MRYEDQQLIREYCRLGLAIATAKNPGTKHEVSEADTLKRGYKLMRQRMEQLSPKKKAAFRAMLKGEIDGVRELITKAKASGEEIGLADIEIEMRDMASGEEIPGAPNVTIDTANDNQQEQDSEPATDPDPERDHPEQQASQAGAHASDARPDDAHEGAGGDLAHPRQGSD